MKQKLLVIFLFFSSLKIFSQTFVMGKVTGDSSVDLPNVSVMNMRTDEVATTQQDGNFIIAAKVSDELRFTRNGYERAVVRLRAEDFSKPLNIGMQLSAQLIEEVEVGFRPTGNLAADTKKLTNVRANNLNISVGKYILKKSEPSVLRPKAGEFVQPVGKGFTLSKKGYKWEVFDLVKYLESALGNDYFTTFGLLPQQQDSFVLFVLKDFPKDEILRFGTISDNEIGQFKNLAETKILVFKRN